MQEQVCKNCGNHFTGKFCNNCGEKVYTEHDKKLSHIFEEAFHFITHFEGTFFKSVRALFTRPGKLSTDYCRGIRKKYFKPVSLFFLFVIVYLLFPRFGGLNMSFAGFVNEEEPVGRITAPFVQKKIDNLQVDYNFVSEKYDTLSPKISKLSLFLLVPFSALFIWLIFVLNRRPFFDHFILATEICTFYIFSHFLFLPFISFLLEKIDPDSLNLFKNGKWPWIVMICIFFIFIGLAFKRFYKQAWWLTILKALIFTLLFDGVIKIIYAVVLFFLVMLFI